MLSLPLPLPSSPPSGNAPTKAPPAHNDPPAAAQTPAAYNAADREAANADGADGAETTGDRELTKVKSSTRENARDSE